MTATQPDLWGKVPVPPEPKEVPLARRLLEEWWERQPARPQQHYVGAVRIIEKALRENGEAWVRHALDNDPPVIAGGALQVAAARTPIEEAPTTDPWSWR